MTLEEFEDQRGTLPCAQCGKVGLLADRVVNNNGVRPLCPWCGSKVPIPGVQFLKQSAQKRRHAGAYNTTTVWAENGDSCAFCGKTAEECQALHIGLTVQHVTPYADGGGRGQLVPFCARCQEMSLAAYKLTRNMRENAEDWRTIIARMQAKQAVLDAERSHAR